MTHEITTPPGPVSMLGSSTAWRVPAPKTAAFERFRRHNSCPRARCSVLESFSLRGHQALKVGPEGGGVLSRVLCVVFGMFPLRHVFISLCRGMPIAETVACMWYPTRYWGICPSSGLFGAKHRVTTMKPRACYIDTTMREDYVREWGTTLNIACPQKWSAQEQSPWVPSYRSIVVWFLLHSRILSNGHIHLGYTTNRCPIPSSRE